MDKTYAADRSLVSVSSKPHSGGGGGGGRLPLGGGKEVESAMDEAAEWVWSLSLWTCMCVCGGGGGGKGEDR